MPHYKDGTKAEVGDHVVGKPYNTDHEVAGTVVSISPGADSCNLMVEYIESLPIAHEIDEEGRVRIPNEVLSAYGARAKNACAFERGDIRLTAEHMTKGAPHIRYICRDYGEVKAFTLVARPAHIKAA